MAQINDIVAQSITPQMVRRISNQLGVDTETAQRGIDLALPLLISKLSRNASEPQGAAALAGAVLRDHTGSTLSQPDKVMQSYASGEGDKILGHIFGNDKANVETTLSKNVGFDFGTLLQILAPLVLSAIAQQMQNGSSSPSSLPGDLEESQPSGGILGALGGLLDANRNGSAIDDVIGMLGQVLQGGFSSSDTPTTPSTGLPGRTSSSSSSTSHRKIG